MSFTQIYWKSLGPFRFWVLSHFHVTLPFTGDCIEVTTDHHVVTRQTEIYPDFMDFYWMTETWPYPVLSRICRLPADHLHVDLPLDLLIFHWSLAIECPVISWENRKCHVSDRLTAPNTGYFCNEENFAKFMLRNTVCAIKNVLQFW